MSSAVKPAPATTSFNMLPPPDPRPPQKWNQRILPPPWRRWASYLGRYTHRIAIGGERLVAHREGQVTFSYKDRKPGGRRRTLTLPGAEFVRRFLLHVVPRRFVRVRHFGLLANGIKIHRLARARSLLGMPAPKEPSRAEPESWQDTYRRLVGREPLLCPACQVGRLVVVAEILPASLALGSAPGSRSP